MKNILSVLSVLIMFSKSGLCQNKTVININYMLRGHIYASSNIRDKKALGGFAQSDNKPHPITNDNNYTDKGVFLKIEAKLNDTNNSTHTQYVLIIGNNSDSTLELEASDSRLDVIAEAFYKNQWRPLEYLPQSWCGNSYHSVFLPKNEYWSFIIPTFTGKIKSRIRYKLILNSQKSLYSNEVIMSINAGQISHKKNYTPQGLMDPYLD